MLAGAGVNAGKRRQLPGGFSQVAFAGCAQEHVRPHQRAGVPLFGVAQGDGKRPQNAAGALEAVELGPASVENFGQVRVKRVAGKIAFLGLPLRFPDLCVERGKAADRCCHVRAKGSRVPNRLGLEKASPQHLGHVLLADRAGAFFHLAAEDVGKVLKQFVSQVVVLLGVGGQQ